MPRRPEKRVPLKQPTSPELLADLLQFIQAKFYPGEPVQFAKDRPRLLSWVALEFSTWLEYRGVTLPPARYLQILRDVILMDALRHGSEKITYRPAWLRACVQKHLAVHGEDYYEEGKSIRALSDRALWAAQRPAPAASDPVRDLAQAARLLRPRSRPKKSPPNHQLTLL